MGSGDGRLDQPAGVEDGLILSCPRNQFDKDILWTRASNEFGWRSLLRDRFASDDVSVYEAPRPATELRGLPPTLIDLLRDGLGVSPGPDSGDMAQTAVGPAHAGPPGRTSWGPFG